jgi:hypothetical protein
VVLVSDRWGTGHSLPVKTGESGKALFREVDQSQFAQGDERAGIGDRRHVNSSSTICSDQRGRMPRARAWRII